LSPSADAGPGARLRTTRPLLAAVSCADFPDQFDDWPLLRSALGELGVDAVTAVWNDPAVDWTAFDLVLANGAWDNIHHVDEFLAWVDRVAASGVPMRNSPATLRWNIDKHYLRDLERAGVPTVPTLWVEPAGRATTDAVTLTLPPGEIVVKPSVSGGGNRTARYQAHEHEAALAHVRQLTEAGRTAMVQPYEPRVDTEGETALVFVGGRYTHALHKEPMIRRGVGPLDHLIDNQVVTGTTASAAQLDVATRALAVAEDLLGPTTYARVDLVETVAAGPALLELELLDPVLFFSHHDDGAAGAAALARELAGRLGLG
jgi:glutathione synthase/RimK-type ligase-like ATP-grasp enzyme